MHSKKIAILQSNYIPWKGYFDLINMVDEFIIFDDVQFTKNDWRNRNKIKTQHGVQWLTIPVTIESLHQSINESRISDPKWNNRHFSTIRQAYAKAKFMREYEDALADLYLGIKSIYLSEINYRFLTKICGLLGITTALSWSSDYLLEGGKTERLVSMCKQAHANEYISGPAAKAYLDASLFVKESIALTFIDYSGYPEYPQLFPPFSHEVSIIDLLLNTGADARRFMKSVKRDGE